MVSQDGKQQTKNRERIVVVTGAKGNLGSAVIQKFYSEEYTVIGAVNALHAEKVSENRTNPVYMPVDLTNEESVSRFFNEVLKNYGLPQLAVLTAGGFKAGGFREAKESDIKSQFELNFFTCYNPARLLFLEMIKNSGGRLYITGARTGMDMQNSKGMTAYGLSKSLVFRLSELLNLEGKGNDFQCTVIVPSTIDTPQNRISMPNADFSKWSKPSEIADNIYAHYNSGSRETVLEV